MKFWAILPAAGIGRRMGSSTPKQYHSICGTPVLIHSINRLLEIPEIEHLVVVLHPKDQYWPAFNFSNERVSTVTAVKSELILLSMVCNLLVDRLTLVIGS